MQVASKNRISMSPSLTIIQLQRRITAMNNTYQTIVQFKQNYNLFPKTIHYSVICLSLFVHSLTMASDHQTPIQTTDYDRLGSAIQSPATKHCRL